MCILYFGGSEGISGVSGQYIFLKDRLSRCIIKMKRFIAVILVILLAAALSTSVWAEQSDDPVPDDAPVSYGFFKKQLDAFKEQLKQEILDELSKGGKTAVTSDYSDLSAQRGEIIILPRGSELILRGGEAVAVTSSAKAGDGITDAASGTELFSGAALEYGHIYLSAGSAAVKAILITGSTAELTVRGDYDRN